MMSKLFSDIVENALIYVDNYVSMRGTIVRVSTVKPIVTKMGFLCILCHDTMQISFQDGKYKVPTVCKSVGCKGKSFIPQRSSEETTNTVDWQKIRYVG